MESKRRAVRALLKKLKSASGESDLLDSITEVRLLSKTDPDSRPLLAEEGIVAILTRVLLLLNDPSESLQENAAAALLNLSLSCRDGLMSTPNLLDSLSVTLRRPLSAAAAQHAAATLYTLLSVDYYRPIIGSKPDIASALVSIISSPAPARSIKDALKALFGISLYPLNRASLVNHGAVPALFSIIVRDGRAGVVEDATAVIAQVAGCEESVTGFRVVSGVRVLVDLMDPVGAGWASARSRENAAAALVNLARSGGERAVGDIREVEEEALAGARGLMASGNSRAEAKAGELLRILRDGREHARVRMRLWGSEPSSELSCSFSSSSPSLPSSSTLMDSVHTI